MARALIVGCGCRGRALGEQLRDGGWQVRGTTREPDRLTAIEAAGIEAALADPDQPGSVLELVGDVTVAYWLLASAQGDPQLLEAIHGPRLERLLEKLVDTPLRGFVYEGAGEVAEPSLARAAELVHEAAERWRIPAEVVMADRSDGDGWQEAMVGAAEGMLR